MSHTTQAVYAAEHVLEALLDRANDCPMVQMHGSTITLTPDAKFGNIESVQRYVDKVLALNWIQAKYPNAARAIKVRKRNGDRAAHYQFGVIAVPDNGRASFNQWAMREIIILHEIAHHLDNGIGHGESFTGIYVELVSEIIGHGTGFALRALYYDEGVKIG